MLSHVRVDRGERVIEQQDRRARVARARERDARLLPSREVDPLLADLRHVAAGQHLEVGQQRARVQRLLVARLVHRRAEQDVATHRVVQDEGRLGEVARTPVELHLGTSDALDALLLGALLLGAVVLGALGSLALSSRALARLALA
eukprot:4653003-Prymnesium_polylepis.1